jgi:hypothetical protein
MDVALKRKWSILSIGALSVLLGAALIGHSQPKSACALDLDQLQRMSPAELDALFRQSELGKPFAGVYKGRLLYLTDKNLPKVKVRLANIPWSGKMAREDGYFTNRWLRDINWIDSHYVIGPSWVDGKPAVIMEYAPGTPLFANMHDELREVAPGLYMGPVYERCPCGKLRGYVALQIDECYCEKDKRLFRRR